MQGFLNKKKDQKEKWKSQYFVLKQEGADCHMYIYEHPKRTKPKGLIDLSCAYMYTVHESLFDKRNVFQLVERALPCLATTTYLSAETASELEDWASAIKPLCVPQMVRSPKVAKLREVRTLFLNISEAHRLPLKLVPNPYCVVSFNQVCIVTIWGGYKQAIFEGQYSHFVCVCFKFIHVVRCSWKPKFRRD